MPTRIQLRRDTTVNWESANPVLAAGEPGLDTTVSLLKYGNGISAWNDLPYAEGDLTSVSTNVLPSANVTYDLGSDTQRWRDIYLSGNSIYLGNTVLSSDGIGGLLIDGTAAATNADVMINRGSDTNNWNNITTLGYYTVNRNSWSGVVGPPLDCQIFKGILQVINTTNGTDTAISQIFLPSEVDDVADVTVQFNRSRWNSTWTSWYKVINTQQIVSGGLF